MDETFIQERIRQLVADSGKSEKLVSRELGRSAGYIQSLTSGKSMPSLLMFFQVCAYFDIEPRDFFDPHISYPLPIQHILSYISDDGRRSCCPGAHCPKTLHQKIRMRVRSFCIWMKSVALQNRLYLFFQL